jgi:hypothetical protein
MEIIKMVKKGYIIDLNKIEEGFLYSEYSCHAENRNEAKSELLKMSRYDGLILSKTDKEIDYLTIPVTRSKAHDLYLFEGEELSKYRVDEILKERERIGKLEDLLKDENVQYCYIRKRGTYYRPGSCGYTERQARAGIYSKEEAVSHARGCAEISLKPVIASEHNKLLQEEIDEMRSRLIAV